MARRSGRAVQCGPGQLELDFSGTSPVPEDPAAPVWPPLREVVLHLPLSAEEEGYTAWRRENEERLALFQQRWGLPVGAQVRVCLDCGESRTEELCGRLVPDDAAPAGGEGIRLRIGARSFHSSRILSAVRLD